MPGSNIAFHIYAELDANEVTHSFTLDSAHESQASVKQSPLVFWWKST